MLWYLVIWSSNNSTDVIPYSSDLCDVSISIFPLTVPIPSAMVSFVAFSIIHPYVHPQFLRDPSDAKLMRLFPLSINAISGDIVIKVVCCINLYSDSDSVVIYSWNVLLVSVDPSDVGSYRTVFVAMRLWDISVCVGSPISGSVVWFWYCIWYRFELYLPVGLCSLNIPGLSVSMYRWLEWF